MPESAQPTNSDLAQQLQQWLAQADEEFQRLCDERMAMGEEKYGPLKFLTVNTLDEAMDEILDLANYARMTYAKFWLLRKTIQDIVSKHPATDVEGFVSLREMMGHDRRVDPTATR